MNKAKEGLYLSIDISLENINNITARIRELCGENYYQKSSVINLATEIDEIVDELREIEEDLKIQDLDLNNLMEHRNYLETRIILSENLLDQYSHEDIEYQVEKKLIDFLEDEIDKILAILKKRNV